MQARESLSRWLNWLIPLTLAGMIVWAVSQGPNTFTAKPQGPFNDPNAFAALLNLLIFPILARWLAKDVTHLRPLWRVSQLALLAGAMYAAFLISSRGAMLALVLLATLLIWRARNVPQAARRRWLLLGVTTVAFLTATYTSSGPSIAHRLADTVVEGDATRMMLFKSSLAMIADHPLLGSGIGSFQLLYEQYRLAGEVGTAGGWVHNDYLQLWLEAGLPMVFLLAALFIWVSSRVYAALRSIGSEQIEPLGYLLGTMAILLHASVNFLLYFAPITILMGIYFAMSTPFSGAHITESTEERKNRWACFLLSHPGQKSYGAWRLAVSGYAFLVGLLLLGQVAVEYLLGEKQYAHRISSNLNMAYSRHEVAYWLSVLAPFSPIPHQVIAFDTADAMIMSNGGNEMLSEALSRMEISIRQVPCYRPFVNAALSMLVKETLDEGLMARGQAIVKQSLDCSPRHGLTYYHAGILDSMKQGGDPLQQWIKGLTMTRNYGEQLLLATAIMVVTQPGKSEVLMPLAKQMSQDLRRRESSPGVLSDQNVWVEAQYKLENCCGRQHFELIEAAAKLRN
ncbi:MAG: O-antigen polymerase [bacterium]|nr:MAG: O-antigen polymerase [bacterium]KAF0149350.1 MAG: O-antigen polymerase [bacterium]KAF0169872.1 MAG: O-antigen polymerase [bacterium]